MNMIISRTVIALLAGLVLWSGQPGELLAGKPAKSPRIKQSSPFVIEATGLPAISADGRQFAVLNVEEIEGFFPAVSLLTFDVNTGGPLDEHELLGPEQVCDFRSFDCDEDRAPKARALAQRLKQVNKLLASGKWAALETGTAAPGACAKVDKGQATPVAVGDLAISYAEPRLTITKGGKPLLDERIPEWSAEFCLRHDDSGFCREECRNKGYVKRAALDVERRVLVLLLGSCPTNDSCWAPGTWTVMTLPRKTAPAPAPE
jgi:hypothetical protein